jgi:hypothetical protein
MKHALTSPWTALAVGIALTLVLYAFAQRLVPHTVG